MDWCGASRSVRSVSHDCHVVPYPQTRTNTRSTFLVPSPTRSTMYSPAPPFRSPSPSFSQSSLKYEDDSSESELGYAPTSAPDETAASPGPSSTAPKAEQGVDTVTCLWDDCGIVFTHLPTLIEHIHSSKRSLHPYASPLTCTYQPTSAFTSQTTLVNGPRATAVDSLRPLGSHSYRTFVRTRERSPSYALDQASRRVPPYVTYRLTLKRMRQILYPL